MSGSRAKRLRREAAATGVSLLPGGWRRLKRLWRDTPRPERRRWRTEDAVRALRGHDEEKVKRALTRMALGKLAALKKRILGG